MKLRKSEYESMRHTIEGATAYAIRRWYKHRDDGPDEVVANAMSAAMAETIMGEIAADWDFDGDE